jgi:C1A family cysteine protease
MNKAKKIITFFVTIVYIVISIIPISATETADSKSIKRACGLIPLSEEEIQYYNNINMEKHNNQRYTVPSSVDLSQSNYFPPIGNQGEIGSCASWASVYYQFGYQVAAMNNWDAAHDQTKRFSPKFVFNIAKSIKGYDSLTNEPYFGSTLYHNYSVLQSQGAVRYSEFTPSTTYSLDEIESWCTNTTYLTNALQNRVSSFGYEMCCGYMDTTPITSPDSQCLNTMKHLLSTGHVLVIDTSFGDGVSSSNTTFPCDLNSNWQFNYASNGEVVCIQSIIPSGKSTLPDHAMAVVGYDDSIWFDYNNNGIRDSFELGAFKLANSWGTSYGNNGYIWVMYDSLNRVSNYLPNNNRRRSTFEAYGYHYMEVSSYELELIAKVSLSHNSRGDINLDLGISSLFDDSPVDSFDTLFEYKGGDYPICGINQSPTALIPFDYGTLISGDRVRKKYYIKFNDSPYSNSTTSVNSVQLIDKTNHVVYNDLNYSSIGNNQTELRDYRIGMLGDVDNDGSVTSLDYVLLSRFFANLTTLSNDDKIAADVNNDGDLDMVDSTIIQRYLVGIYDELPGGYLVNLDKEVVPDRR